MRDFILEFSPFSFITLTEGKVTKQVNEHSTAYVKGIIAQDAVEEYLDLNASDEHLPFSITAVASDGEKVIVFQGVTTYMDIDHEGNVSTMTVEAKSGSYLMDVQERFRTFQDPWVSHSHVLELLGETYADYNFIIKTTGEQAEEAEAESPSLSKEQGLRISSDLLQNMREQFSALTADGADRPSSHLSEPAARISNLLSGDRLNMQAVPQTNSEPEIALLPADHTALVFCMQNALQSARSSGQLSAITPADRGLILSCMGQNAALSRLTPKLRGDVIATMDQAIRTMDEPAKPLSLSPLSTSDLLSKVRQLQQGPDIKTKIQDFPLGQFTVQYLETDWAFAKRLASRQNTFLVPADTFPGVRYYFGVPHLKGHTLDESVDYKVVKDGVRRDKQKRLGLSNAQHADAISYVIKHREIFAVGDHVNLRGMELFIDKIVTDFTGQELVHTYYLRPQKGLRTARVHNDRMIGASLDAQVLAVQRDEVQVQIIGDENADQTIIQWFPFATVYSSPDGTGWFAMPEIGDFVRLYIPGKEEKHAVVFNAVHAESEARSNPDIKSMRNKFGKEIRFTPNTLVMTNNAGMEIAIIDGEGVRIESDKNIFVKADGNIDISCASGLSMLGGDSVVVEQSGTSLVVDDNVAFVGGKLRMQ